MEPALRSVRPPTAPTICYFVCKSETGFEWEISSNMLLDISGKQTPSLLVYGTTRRSTKSRALGSWAVWGSCPTPSADSKIQAVSDLSNCMMKFCSVFFFFCLRFELWLWLWFSTDQRLDLCKLNASDSDAVRGQIVGTYNFELVKRGHSCFLELSDFLISICEFFPFCIFSKPPDPWQDWQRRACGRLSRTVRKWRVSGSSVAEERGLLLFVQHRPLVSVALVVHM